MRNKTFLLVFNALSAKNYRRMKSYTKILLAVFAAIVCTASFAADKESCSKSGKNCPMNDGKACNCGKDCGCGK